jgi:hypothetical protein
LKSNAQLLKLHIETSEMSKDNIKELLLTRNANPVAVDDFIALD